MDLFTNLILEIPKKWCEAISFLNSSMYSKIWTLILNSYSTVYFWIVIVVIIIWGIFLSKGSSINGFSASFNKFIGGTSYFFISSLFY